MSNSLGRIAIILPVFNNIDFTKKALEDLQSQLVVLPKQSIRVLVIDDGSTDGTSEFIAKYYPEVILLQGDGNLWWSGGINRGARYVMENKIADFILLWNNDIRVSPDYFSNLIELLLTAEHKTIIGSKILIEEKPELVWSMGGYFNPRTGKHGMYGYYEYNQEKFNKVCEADWLTGMGTLIPVEAINTIGYWDEKNFPQYHGDSDFTYRAKLAGFNILVHPKLVMYNSVGNSGIEHQGSLKKVFNLLTDLRSKSNLKKNFLFYKKYSSSPLAYLPLLALYSKIFLGFFKWKMLNFFGIEKQLAA